MADLKLPTYDPIKRDAEKDCPDDGISPMDPPDAYAPPKKEEEVDYKKMHPFLQRFHTEHQKLEKELNQFEEAILTIQKEGITKEADAKLRHFFHYLDEEISEHNQREEKLLFPLLQEKLIEHGEYSKGEEKTTAIDVLEADHGKALQLTAVIFNFFGLSIRLPDTNSRLIVLDSAIEQGKELVENLRLHSFREETIILPLAHKYISKKEFDALI